MPDEVIQAVYRHLRPDYAIRWLIRSAATDYGHGPGRTVVHPIALCRRLQLELGDAGTMQRVSESRLLVRAEKPLPVEVDEMRRVFSAPHVGLPRDMSEVFSRLLAVREHRDVYQPGGAVGEQ